MPGVNLMPAYRAHARRRRRRLRRWAGALAAHAGVLLAAYGFCDAVWGSDTRALSGGFDRAAGRIADSRRQIEALQHQLAESQRLLDANRLLADQPDWSLLMAGLGETLGEDIVLTHCELGPAPVALTGVTGAPTPAAGSGFVLALHGFGRSQAAVAQFVLRLEQTGLFDTVKLIKINRESFLAGEAVAFQVQCLLAGRGATIP